MLQVGWKQSNKFIFWIKPLIDSFFHFIICVSKMIEGLTSKMDIVKINLSFLPSQLLDLDRGIGN